MGDAPATAGCRPYDTEYGRVGLGICFDIHTILEKYEPHKIWCLLYPIAWVDTEHPADWMFHRLPERVKPFKHHLVGANWSVDKKQDWRGLRVQRHHLERGQGGGEREEPLRLGDRVRRAADREVTRRVAA